jgi:MYXO-CTERM domain-containing protein
MAKLISMFTSLCAVALLTLHAAQAEAPGHRPPQARLSIQLRYLSSLWNAGLPLRVPGDGLRPRTPDEALPAANRPPTLHASILFEAAPGTDLRARLADLGIVFPLDRGILLPFGESWPARVPIDRLEEAAALPGVLRIEAHFPSPSPAIKDQSPALTEAAQAWASLDDNGYPIDGAGVSIGALDSWIDIFHPSFFYADGGLFDWIDVDSDATFSPGVDAVDFNLNGIAEKGEKLIVVKCGIAWDDLSSWPEPEKITENMDGPFVPDLDWLYMDQNSSGKREMGATAGFVENSPAFGEPLFLADDLDRSGTLDPGEKLALLKTSKLKAIYLPFADELYERGKNLLAYEDYTAPASHATMTVGILAAGDGRRQRLHGLAPEADILLADMESGWTWNQDPEGDSTAPYMAALVWAVEKQEAGVVMHEYGSPIFEFGDGSSDLEQAIDSAAENSGVANCTASHNYAGYPMHGKLTVPAGGSKSFHIDLSTWLDYGATEYLTQVLYATVRWRQPLAPIRMVLVLPEGGEYAMEGDPFEAYETSPYLYYAGHELSPRSTMMAGFALFPDPWDEPDGYSGVLKAGTYELRMENPGGVPQVVDLFLSDQFGYLITGNIHGGETTQVGTIAHPATADSAIAVAAYCSNVDDWFGAVPIGGLSYYSGRGPRIDGELALDLAAPSDALVPWHDPAVHYPLLSYASGTSGALPQVTAAIALLLQARPGLTPKEIQTKLLGNVLKDEHTGNTPNFDWGYGKLSVFRTIFGMPPPDKPNTPPVASVQVPEPLCLGAPLLLDLSSSTDKEDPPGSLMARCDVGYDGLWDGPFSHDLACPLGPFEAPGRLRVVVELRDAAGATARKLVAVEIGDDLCPVGGPEPAGRDDGPAPDSSGAAADASGDRVGPGKPEPTLVKRGGDEGCSTAGTTASPAPWAALLLLLALAVGRLKRTR